MRNACIHTIWNGKTIWITRLIKIKCKAEPHSSNVNFLMEHKNKYIKYINIQAQFHFSTNIIFMKYIFEE